MFCFSSSLLKYSDYSEKYVLFAKLYYNIKKNEFSGKLKKIGKMQLYNKTSGHLHHLIHSSSFMTLSQEGH